VCLMTDYRFQAIKEFVEALLKDKRCLYGEENVLYCEKLFTVNRVMSHVRDKLADDELSLDDMKRYLLYINEYLDGYVELEWWENKLVAFNTNKEVDDAEKEKD